MANIGDSYVITLKPSHLDWGSFRNTSTRGYVAGEGYIPIPLAIAKQFNILNSNGTHGIDRIGLNIFRFSTADGRYRGFLRAQGCNSAGEIYAKQFAGDGDLKLIGRWFSAINAIVGTQILVKWVSPDEIVLSKVN